MHPQRLTQGIGLRNFGKAGFSGGQHQADDAHEHGAEREVDNVVRQGQANIGSDDGRGGSDQGRRHRELKIGNSATQQGGAGRQRARERDQQAGAAHEIQMEREKGR